MVAWRDRLRWMAIGAIGLVLLGAGLGFAFLFSGLYNVAASSGHTKLVYWALQQGMLASVRRHAADVRPPSDLLRPGRLRLGAHCYHEHCMQCHGAPGISPHAIGKGLLPIPSSLTQTARDWPVEQLYWVTRNGIRMAGMPAWEYRLADADLWAIAAFVDHELPRLTVSEYRKLVAEVADLRCSAPSGDSLGDPERGLIALRQYACHGCHIIPGVTGPEIYVGPPLQGFARRGLIAGVLPNTHDNLVRWLREPQAVSPRTLMPDLGVTESHALDMAAYLETLK